MRNSKMCYVAFLLFSIVFPVQAEEFTIAVAGAPRTFDSRVATDAWSVRLLRLIASPLVQLDDKFQPVPALAKSWAVKDNKVFKLFLTDVKFHDGSPFTSHEVKRFYQSIKNGDVSSPLLSQLKDLEKIETPDELTIIFHFSQPQLWFWKTLETPLVKVTDDMKEFPVGTGSLRLERSDEYGNVRLVSLDGKEILNFQVIKNPMVRLLKTMKGEVDISHGDLSSELYEYGLQQGLKGKESPSASYTYIGFNLEDQFTGHKELRKSLALATNIPKIQKALLGGRANKADSLLLPKHPGHWSAIQSSYNPKESERMLDASGFKKDEDGIRLKLRLSITTNPFVMRLSQILQQEWRKVGIDLQLESSEWGSFYSRVKKGNFQMFILSWVGEFDVDIYDYLFHSRMKPPYGANRGRFNNPQVDRMLEEMMSSEYPVKRAGVAQKIQLVISDEQVYIPLWRKNHVALMRPEIEGYSLPQDGGYEGLTSLYRDLE